MRNSGLIDVLIVGAGPVGLTAALELSRFGKTVRIIDTKPGHSNHSKAIGINVRTLELLEPSGVTETLLKEGTKIHKIIARSNSRVLFEVEFSQLKHRYNFMLALPQSETEQVIERRLNEFGVQVERATTFENFEQNEGYITSTLDSNGEKMTVKSEFLVGADGAHSTVRHKCGIDFPGSKFPGDWSLADIRAEIPWDYKLANVSFQNNGILFMLQFKEGVYRIASNKPNVTDRLPEGAILNEVIWQSDFAVSHRQVPVYSQGRVFLAGDAAHIHSPLGGRGMNMGIEDAATLAEFMVEDRLENYSSLRHEKGASTISMVKAQTHITTTANPFICYLRNKLIPVLLNFDFIHQKMIKTMLGL